MLPKLFVGLLTYLYIEVFELLFLPGNTSKHACLKRVEEYMHMVFFLSLIFCLSSLVSQHMVLHMLSGTFFFLLPAFPL